MTELTQRCEFECAYIMYSTKYDDELRTYITVPELNAHHYTVSVTVASTEHTDMIIEFKDLRDIINHSLPDGRFLYNANDPDGSSARIIADAFEKANVLPYKYNFVITAENLVNKIANDIQEMLIVLRHEDVVVTKVVLKETADSATTWILNS